MPQVQTGFLTIKNSTEAESGTITFENTPQAATSLKKWVIQPRSFVAATSTETAGYDALVISSDTSNTDNTMHRQLVLLAEHTAPAAAQASGELRAKGVSATAFVRYCSASLRGAP